MKISFVVPAYNEEALLGKCLEAIQRATAAATVETEVIVVNNASTDRTKEIASSFAGVTVVDEPRKGLTWARRAGFLASSGDLIANIDADTVMPPKWLPTVVKEFSNDSSLLALSGPYIYYDAPRYIRILTRISYILGYAFDRLFSLFGWGGIFQGGNYVVQRDALEKVGGYNTSIEFYGEDTDVAERLLKIGKVVWTFRLPMHSSGRRIVTEGFFTMAYKYGINYLWITFSKKPFTEEYIDIRE